MLGDTLIVAYPTRRYRSAWIGIAVQGAQSVVLAATEMTTEPNMDKLMVAELAEFMLEERRCHEAHQNSHNEAGRLPARAIGPTRCCVAWSWRPPIDRRGLAGWRGHGADQPGDPWIRGAK